MAMDDKGDIVLAGSSISPDYPLTPGAYGADAGPFLVKAVVTRMSLLPEGVVRLGDSTPGCHGALLLGVLSQPRLGATDFGIYAGNAAPNASLGALLVGLSAASSPAHLHQAEIWLDPASLAVVIPWSADATGYVEVPARIPDDSVLVGLQAWIQGVFKDPCAPGHVAATPALGLVIQP